MIYAAIPLSLILLWVLFLAYAGLRANWKYLRPEVKAVGIFVVALGLVVDVAINWTLGLCLGITPDLTLSQKCKRLGNGDGWRRIVAKYICLNWLNVFDPGHC